MSKFYLSLRSVFAVLFFLLLTPHFLYSQGEIPVDMYTGTPTIQVPLWTASYHDINLPIVLSYSVNGIRGGQSQGSYGLGWNLIATGSIIRQLKGLPDDFTGTGSDLRRGWLYSRSGGSGVASEVGAIGNSTDLNAGTPCTDETADYNTLSIWNDLIDTEPDVFSFNFGGYSGCFVFDNNATPAIHFIPYQDFSISYTSVSGSDKSILSFTIKTNNGYKYTFGRTVTSSKKITKGGSINSVTFLSHEFNQYNETASSPPVQYSSEWKLSRIDSPSGAYAVFTYTLIEDDKVSDEEIQLGIQGRNFSAVVEQYGFPHTLINPYTIKGTTDLYLPDSISGSSGQVVKFIKNGELLEKVIVKDFRREAGDAVVKEYLLAYYGTFLKSVTEYAGCDRKPPYSFEYITNPASATIQNTADVVDFWGFPTGRSNDFVFSNPYYVIDGDHLPKLYVYPDLPLPERFRIYPIPNYMGTTIILDGTDRTPDENAMRANTLNKIIYPSGGGAVIQYEANRYYDQLAGQTQLAGGLRVKSITEFDGMNNVGRITKEFLYTNPTTGQSSGKLISKPQFAMLAWKYRDPTAINDANKDLSYSTLYATKTTSDLWKFLTIRSESDLSDQESTHGSTVGYQFVTVKRTGAGSARFEFLVPGTFAETTNGYYWTATQNKFARPSTCSPMSLISLGGEWGFPFSTNPDIDHERGLLSKKSEFNEAGVLVRLTQNVYQYLFKTGTQPNNVWGIHYDKYPNSDDNVYFFGKYFLPTDYQKVLSKETITTYDAADTIKKVIESNEYFYESSYHKFVTKTKHTTGDGTIYTNKIKYAGDFGSIAANSEQALLRIKEMQDPLVFRQGTPIEQFSLVKPVGGTEKTTGASLSLFSDFSKPNKILFQSAKSLSIVTPVTDFAETSIQLQSGTYKLISDGRYETINTIVDYDNYDRPIAQVGIDNVTSSTVWGFNQTTPVATLNNTGKDEFVFSDLETTTASSFQLTNAFYATPRTGVRGLHPYATMTKTIVKGQTSNYILSFWLKNSGAVSFRVIVKSTNLVTTYSDNTFSITPAGSDFELVRRVINVTSYPSSFVIQILGQSLTQPSASSSTLLPAIDDISFIPETADLISSTYNLPFGATSVTNPFGVSAYTDYDKLGRQTFVYDQDKNIRSKNTYAYSVPVLKLDAFFSTPLKLMDNGGNGVDIWQDLTAYRDEPVVFTARGNPCFGGATYEWNMDVGSASFVTGTTQKTYTFTTSKPYKVQLRVNAPGEQTVTYEVKINVISKPIEITVCANGARIYECDVETYRSNNCPSNPTPPATGTVIFYASLIESLSNVTYTWKKRYFDDETWTVVFAGVNSNEFTMPQTSHMVRGFEIKCEVSTSDGRIGESNATRIEVYPCP